MPKTLCSVIVMILSALVGLFIGGAFNNCIGGMILTTLFSGIACIVYTIEACTKDK